MNLKRLAALLLFAFTPAFTQSAGGVAGISGVVRDSAEAVIPNAKVVISSHGQGEARSVTTNEVGIFSATALIPEIYKVTVTANGFSTYEADNLVLSVGQNLDLNIVLTVGGNVTSVDVTATAAMVADTRSDASTVVSNQQIDELPINGRRVDSFVLLTPAVTNDANFGLLSFRGVAGNNSFLLDGNDNTQQFYNENAGRTRIQTQISQDAVQEFQVVSADYSAQYGRAMGGVVNTVTKSGTNDFHGTGFYYFRSTAFDARDPFAAFNPSERRVQGGATAGGKIIKDKLFYLLNFDLTHRNFPIVDSYVAPGVIDPASHTWVGCGAPATPAQCSAINTLLPRFYGVIPRTGDNDLGFGRIDYHPNDKHTFTAQFNYLRWWSPNGLQNAISSTTGTGINTNGDDSVRLRNGKFGWTFVPSSKFVNTFRFGYNNDRESDTFDQAQLGSGLGYLDVSVAGVQLGPATTLPRVFPNETRHEFSDDATLVKSNHTVQFGFSYIDTQDATYSLNNAFGSYTYLNPTQFALDYSGSGTGKNWTTFTQGFGNPVVDFHIKEPSWYILDQWRRTSRLTINLGLRWDKSLGIKFPVSNPDWPQTGSLHSPSGNFSPRIGLAYRLDDNTVLRAGYGIYYSRLIGYLVNYLAVTNGIYQTAISLSATNPVQQAAGPVFPTALSSAPAAASVGAANIQFAAPNLKTPYSQQANLTLERQLAPDLALTASAIWSRGVDLLGAVDLNVGAFSNYTYAIADSAGNPVDGVYTTPLYSSPRPNTNYGSVIENTNGVDSRYSALAVTLTKTFSRNFQGLASYTWSHEIDDGQGVGANALSFNTLGGTSSGVPYGATYNGNNRFEKANGLLDQRQRLALSFVWSPVVSKGHSDWVQHLGNNWQLSGITTIASGRPAGSPIIRVSVTGPTGLLNPSTINGLGANPRVPFLPPNSILTPASYRADLRLTRIIPLSVSERPVKLFLNFEVFNISNSWSPTAMSLQEYVEDSRGVLRQTPGAYGIGTADGGFPDGTQARRMQVSARIRF